MDVVLRRAVDGNPPRRSNVTKEIRQRNALRNEPRMETNGLHYLGVTHNDWPIRITVVT